MKVSTTIVTFLLATVFIAAVVAATDNKLLTDNAELGLSDADSSYTDGQWVTFTPKNPFRFEQRYMIKNGLVWTETTTIVRATPQRVMEVLCMDWSRWWKGCEYKNRHVSASGSISYVFLNIN